MNAILALLQQGVTVANPKAWQTAQVAGTALGGLLLAIVNCAHTFGYTLPVQIDAATANEIGSLAMVGFNIVMSAASHSHIGLLPPTDGNGK